MFGHPSEAELFVFAEALADRRPIPAGLASHVKGCESCRGEVLAVRASLETAKAAPALEPSAQSAKAILEQAQQARQRGPRKPAGVFMPAAKAAAFAACLMVSAAVYFNAASGGGMLSLGTLGIEPETASASESAESASDDGRRTSAPSAPVRVRPTSADGSAKSVFQDILMRSLGHTQPAVRTEPAGAGERSQASREQSL